MPERPVIPSECALAVAFPLSSDELLADLVSASPSDFVLGIRRLFPAAPPRELCRLYADEVAAVGSVVAQALSLGVMVAPRARLADLAWLTERYHVVSVLAHAPSEGVEAEDIVDVPLLVDLARTGISPDQKRVRRMLRYAGFDLGPTAPLPPAEAIAAVLGRLLWTIAPAGTRRRGQIDRTQIEDAFPGAVRPAPVLELRDGLHLLDAVRGAIAPSFQGVLDLSTCTSVVLGEALKRGRSDFLVVNTLRSTTPKRRLLQWQIRMRELGLARAPVRFTDVVSVVAEALALAARRR